MSDAFRLFCFPCAGSSATSYLRWRKISPPWLSVQIVELPGRGSRVLEPLHRDFDQLVDILVAELRQSITQTYAFLGHSLGAVLAFNCALRFRDMELPLPQALVVCGSPGPRHWHDERYAHLRTDKDLIAELRSRNGTPPEVFENAELLRMTLDILAADFALCTSYQAKANPPLAIPIHIFGGKADDIPAQALESWALETAGQATLDMLDGGHFFLRERETEFLSRVIARLQPLIGSQMRTSVSSG
jgi:surfactin synthase thioesterase subunit